MNKKLQRQLQLAGLLKESKTQPLPFELVREGNDGKTYVISRENSKYYIKTANTTENLQENDFDYLGGLANMAKHSFKSFESATFKLNLIFESDRENEESISLLSEKKFVLKQPKKKKKKKIVEPDLDLGGEEDEEDFDFGDEEGSEEGGDEDFSFDDEPTDGGDEDFSFGDEESSEEEGEFSFGDEESDEFGGDEFSSDDESEATGDTVKDIQSLTGKLGQKVRNTEDLSSDMQKWVAKSVISALNMDSLDDGDKQDIINSLDGNDLDESNEEEYTETPKPNRLKPWEKSDANPNFHKKEDLETPRGGERYDRDELLFDADGYEGDGVVDEVNQEVMSSMKDQYGDEAKQVYYATANKQGRDPETFDIEEDEEDDFILRASDLKRPPTGRGYFRESFQKPIMKEDHLEEKMESDYQLETYLDIESIVGSYDLTLGWCHSDGDTIYLDLKDGEEKLAKILIDYDGDVEIGEMVGDKFVGEPLDDLSEIDELLGVMNNELDENMMENEETPVKTPTRTKPGTTPSRRDRTFKPPSPTENPKPKAFDDNDSPAPAKPKTTPTTKPGTSPSRREQPFRPPVPTEDPKPKAGDDEGFHQI